MLVAAGRYIQRPFGYCATGSRHWVYIIRFSNRGKAKAMTEQERVLVEEELLHTLNPDQLAIEGIERTMHTPKVRKVFDTHDDFADGLPLGVALD